MNGAGVRLSGAHEPSGEGSQVGTLSGRGQDADWGRAGEGSFTEYSSPRAGQPAPCHALGRALRSQELRKD